MAKDGMKVNVTLEEIVKCLCPKCKANVRLLMRSKVTDAMLAKVMGESN